MGGKASPSADYLLPMGIGLLAYDYIAIASPAVEGTSVVIGAVLVVSGLAQVPLPNGGR